MKTAFLFPGQGAQFVGMGADVAGEFPAAAEIFNKANAIVGYDLKKLCVEGPAEELNKASFSPFGFGFGNCLVIGLICHDAG